MNYLIGILITALVIIFLYAKSLYDDNRQLEESNKLIITGYETSFKVMEDKYKFENDTLKEKLELSEKSEKTKIENEKRGKLNESDNIDNFVITSF